MTMHEGCEVKRRANWFKAIWFFSLFLFSPLSGAYSLSELIELAVTNNPEAEVSRSLSEAARLDTETARWQYYPTPVFNVVGASASNSDQSFLGDDYVATVGLSQPIWSGGLIASELEEAQFNLSVREADEILVQQDLALRVVAAYTNWHAAYLTANAWQRGLVVHQRLSDQVQRRVADGASSESDLALANARMLQVEADMVSARAQEYVALSELVALIGSGLDSNNLSSSQALPIVIDAGADDLVETAFRANPLIAQAFAEKQLAEAEIDTLRAQRRPEINLRLERQYGDLAFANSEPSNRILFEVTSRFGAGLSSRSEVSSAQMRHNAASFNVEAQRKILAATIESEYALKISIDRQLIAMGRSEQATRDVYESFERQFLSGSRSWLDLLNAARELTQIEIRNADAQISSVLVSWRLSILSRGLNATLQLAN